MQLTDFCAQKAQVLAQQPPIILFVGKHYSPLAFAQILKWLQAGAVVKQNEDQKLTSAFSASFTKNPGIPSFEQASIPFISSLQKLDLDCDIDQLKMKLHTTFLGQTRTFWFGDLSLITSKKKKADWLLFLKTYQGPHQIIGWLDEDDISNFSSKNNVIVTVAELYSSDMIHKISFLYQDHKPEICAYFFGRLYRVKKEFSLEQLCLLQKYAGLVGKGIDLFFEQWLENMVVSDVSLFSLAQLFFEKRADEFFQEWHQVRGNYSDQFWTVFFSDQLFKAYFYVSLQGRIDQTQKQMTYGLPFSFLKHDWKLYSAESLNKAHEQLYDVDIALKTGASSYGLDNFLMQFFV